MESWALNTNYILISFKTIRCGGNEFKLLVINMVNHMDFSLREILKNIIRS